MEQIHNKLKISENVQQTILYVSILKVPRNQSWAFSVNQNGIQDDRKFHYLSYLLIVLNRHQNVNKESKLFCFFGARNSILTLY